MRIWQARFAERGFGFARPRRGLPLTRCPPVLDAAAGDARGADLGRSERLAVAVPVLHPLLAPGTEPLHARAGASSAVEGFGPAATGFDTCGFGPTLLWQGNGLALGAAKGLGPAPVSILPRRISAPLDLLDGSARLGRRLGFPEGFCGDAFPAWLAFDLEDAASLVMGGPCKFLSGAVARWVISRSPPVLRLGGRGFRLEEKPCRWVSSGSSPVPCRRRSSSLSLPLQ